MASGMHCVASRLPNFNLGGIAPDSLRELVESRDTNASAERLRSLRGAEGIAQQLGSNAKTGLSDERARQNKVSNSHSTLLC